jgi:hypothetical protein
VPPPVAPAAPVTVELAGEDPSGLAPPAFCTGPPSRPASGWSRGSMSTPTAQAATAKTIGKLKLLETRMRTPRERWRSPG